MRSLLREADTDLNARRADGPSALDLARVGHSAASQLVAAAAVWTPVTHEYFPWHARAHARELLRLGYQLARDSGHGRALLDPWITVIGKSIDRDRAGQM